jgi:acetylornithine deacetylase/succinyl-diaminopimelate desuccinylase-like protein
LSLSGWVINQLKKFVSIPTISAQRKGIKEAIQFLTRLGRELGLKVSVLEVEGANPVFYAEKFSSGAKKTVLFYNHYDVQPADPLSEWGTEPFTLAIREDKIFGRGVADNKGDLITRLGVVKFFQLQAKNPPVNLKFFFEGEEEIGSPSLKKVLQKYPGVLKADFCFWEGGTSDEENNPILILGCKGILSLELVIKGARQDLHSSLGVIVKSPAWEMCHLLNSLRSPQGKVLIEGFYEKVKKISPAEVSLLKKLKFHKKKYLKEMNASTIYRKNSDLLFHYFYGSELNINGLTSGYQGKGQKTIIPHSASVKLDFRLVPNQTPAEILRKLRQHLRSKNFRTVEIKEISGYPPASTSPHHPFTTTLTQAYEKITGQNLLVHPFMAGSGPMYLFASSLPCFGLGISSGDSNIHAPNEFIWWKNFLKGPEVMARLLTELG